MPNKNGVIAVGVELDYQKTLNKMVGDFKSEMSQIQQTLGKAHLSKDLERQIANLTERIEEVATTASKSFDDLGKGKISTETFKKFESEVDGKFQNIRREITILTSNLDDLAQRFDLLQGAEFSNKIMAQFKEIQNAVLNTNSVISNFYKIASQNGMELNLIESDEQINKLKKSYYELSDVIKSVSKADDGVFDTKDSQSLLRILSEVYDRYSRIDDAIYDMTDDNEIKNAKLSLEGLSHVIIEITEVLADKGINFSSILNLKDIEDVKSNIKSSIDSFKGYLINEVSTIEKEISDRGGSLVSPEMFTIKDGTIKVPIDIETNVSTLNNKLNKILESMQANAKEKAITVPITLVTNESIKTAKDAKDEIDRVMNDDTIINMGKTYDTSLKKALKSATFLAYEAIRSVKDALVKYPVVIHPQFKIYKKDLVAFQKAVNQYSKELNIDLSTQVQDLSKELNKLYSEKNISTWSKSMEKHLDKVLGKIKEISDFIKGSDGSNNTLNTFFDNIDTQKLEGLLGIVAEISKALVFLKQDLKLENIDNFQKDIIELKDSLKEMSSALSSNQKLTFGIDEQSINRITTSIEHMSNMLSRAFGVATDADIASQWNLVDQKFKSIADESGKINLNKSKKDVQELITLYQEYVSMGGTNQLGVLTDNTQTVEKLNKKWEQVKSTVSETIEKEKTQALLPELEADVKLTPNADGFKSEADKLLDNINLEKEVNLSVGNIATTTSPTSQETPVSSDTTAVEKVKENLKEVEVQAEKTEQAVKEAVNVPSNESTLSNAPIDTSKSVVELNDLLEKINKVESAVRELSNVSISLDVKLPKKIDDTTIEAFGKLKAIFDGNNIWINELKTLSDAFANLKVSKTLSTNLVDVAIGLEELSKQINSIDIGGSTFLKDINELLSKGDELKNLASVLKTSQKQIKEAAKNVSGSTTSKSDTSKIEKQQRKLQELRDKFDTKLSLKDDVANADDFIERLNKIEVILNKYPDGSNVDFLSEETKKDFEEISKLFKELDGKEFKLGNQTKAKKTILDINTYLKENTKITAEAKTQLQNLLAQLDGFGGTPQDLQRITQEFLEIKNSMVVAGKEGKSFFTGIRGQIKHMWEKGIAQWFSLYDIIRYGRQVVETIKEIDTATTELRKVSDATEQRLSQNFRNSAKTAKDLGSSISDVINATSDWSRMGYSVDEAEELAKISTLYKNVGDGIDIDVANESLVSTLQGFQMDASEAESIVDKFNEVAKFWRNCMVTYG